MIRCIRYILWILLHILTDLIDEVVWIHLCMYLKTNYLKHIRAISKSQIWTKNLTKRNTKKNALISMLCSECKCVSGWSMQTIHAILQENWGNTTDKIMCVQSWKPNLIHSQVAQMNVSNAMEWSHLLTPLDRFLAQLRLLHACIFNCVYKCVWHTHK